MSKTYIVNYGMGNLGSVVNMIRRMGSEIFIASDPTTILSARRLIVPGVGSFDNGMTALNNLGFSDAIREAALIRRIPILGICLGMQLFLDESEEGLLPGLGLVSGRVRLLDVADQGLPVPHMGWNSIKITNPSKLISANEIEQRYYFVHSYAAECTRDSDVTGITHYGHDFVSIFEKENIMGVQFHPEKSHRFGMSLFEKFLRL